MCLGLAFDRVGQASTSYALAHPVSKFVSFPSALSALHEQEVGSNFTVVRGAPSWGANVRRLHDTRARDDDDDTNNFNNGNTTEFQG